MEVGHPIQVGSAVLWRDKNTDPESEGFGNVIEWWELFPDCGSIPKGAVPVYVHDDATPQDWTD